MHYLSKKTLIGMMMFVLAAPLIGRLMDTYWRPQWYKLLDAKNHLLAALMKPSESLAHSNFKGKVYVVQSLLKSMATKMIG